MLPGEFERKLKKCNSNIKIIPPPDLHTRPAGMYLVNKDGLEHLGGTDCLELPDREYVDSVGHIIKRGWRKTVEILIRQGVIKKGIAEKVFCARLGIGYLKPPIEIKSKETKDIRAEVTKQSLENSALYGNPRGNILLKKDQIMDFAYEMQKELSTDEKKEDLKRRRQTIGY